MDADLIPGRYGRKELLHCLSKITERKDSNLPIRFLSALNNLQEAVYWFNQKLCDFQKELNTAVL